MSTEILRQLTELLRDAFDNDDLVATAGQPIRELAGWDSLGHLRLYLAVDDTFGTSLTASEMGRIQTLGELASAIAARTANASR